LNPLLLLAAFGSRPKVLQTVTFNANATWVAPDGISLLASVVGRGAPGTSGGSTFWTYYTTRTEYFVDASGNATPLSSSSSGPDGGSSLPEDYCDAPVSAGSGSTMVCYEFSGTAYSAPPTTGASATGFGKTFSGGTGGAATATTYNNVAVAPSTGYPVVVPSGATIQIT
jgi:hypothetical protein